VDSSAGPRFATQAGGIGNDLMGALFVLASVHFGLRGAPLEGRKGHLARDDCRRVDDGIQTFQPAVAAAVLVAVWPRWSICGRRLVGTVVVAGIALMVSAHRRWC